jgi:glucosamine-6-phosphate deaminase
MEVIVLDDAQAVARKGASLIAGLIKTKPAAVLGLATGRTPLDMYRRLVDIHKKQRVSFAEVTTFNLDEYLGIGAHSLQSYRSYMDREFFNHIDINLANTHLPACVEQESPRRVGPRYEAMIRGAGGIDLQVLGIGQNGHIGFNEPGSSLGSRTRIKTLAKRTLEDNSQLFEEGEFQPRLAITMGIATICDARKILILATGKHKAQAVAATVEGPVTAWCPASILQMHEFVTLLVDQEAASQLKNRDYYALACSENEALHQRFGRFPEDV